jgi:hypothetical protein
MVKGLTLLTDSLASAATTAEKEKQRSQAATTASMPPPGDVKLRPWGSKDAGGRCRGRRSAACEGLDILQKGRKTGWIYRWAAVRGGKRRPRSAATKGHVVSSRIAGQGSRPGRHQTAVSPDGEGRTAAAAVQTTQSQLRRGRRERERERRDLQPPDLAGQASEVAPAMTADYG